MGIFCWTRCMINPIFETDNINRIVTQKIDRYQLWLARQFVVFCSNGYVMRWKWNNAPFVRDSTGNQLYPLKGRIQWCELSMNYFSRNKLLNHHLSVYIRYIFVFISCFASECQAAIFVGIWISTLPLHKRPHKWCAHYSWNSYPAVR